MDVIGSLFSAFIMIISIIGVTGFLGSFVYKKFLKNNNTQNVTVANAGYRFDDEIVPHPL